MSESASKEGILMDKTDDINNGCDSAFSLLTERVISATQQPGKTALVALAAEDPENVESVLSYLCAQRHFLHHACLTGDDELVAYLAGSSYIDINAKSPLGTPLSVACEHGYECVVDTLLCLQAEVPKPACPLDNFNGDEIKCPFYQAAVHGWVNIIQMLVESAQDVKTCLSLMQSAFVGGHKSVVEYCLDVLPKLVTNREVLLADVRTSLLPICLHYGHLHLLQKLVELGAQLTEELCDIYSESVSEFLQSYITAENGLPVHQLNTPTYPALSADWSTKGLCVIRETWLAPYSAVLSDVILSSNNFSILPGFIPWKMPALRFLVVSYSKLQKFSVPESGNRSILCTKLERLNLSFNQLQTIPLDVFCLPSLTHLNVSHNELVELGTDVDKSDSGARRQLDGTSKTQRRQLNVICTDELWSCLLLKNLNISHNSIFRLPYQLQVCGHLNTLDVSYNNLTEFLPPWHCPMKWLDLSHNEIVDMPLGLEDYWGRSLRSLMLSHNHITQISQSVCRLAALKDLDFSFNELTFLPNPLWWTCEQLEQLNLSGNKIGSSSLSSSAIKLSRLMSLFSKASDAAIASTSAVTLPHEVFGAHLTDLNLSHNELSCVPTSVCQLRQLTRLDLSYNVGLVELPDELCQLNHLEQLYLDGLKLTDQNLRRQPGQVPATTRHVLAYLKQKHRKSVPCTRLQLMIVGSQNKGKTTLACALRGVAVPRDVATDGVTISQWELRFGTFSSERINVQMWDFAGQQDYYVTHKVFLSSSAIYLLVFDLRLQKEGVESLKPWLSDIQAHAPTANVIIVGTYLDALTQDGRSRLANLEKLIVDMFAPDLQQSRAPRVFCTAVSGTTRENIPRLKELIWKLAKTIQVKTDVLCREHLIGKMVPMDYIKLAEKVQSEADRRMKLNMWPVLSEDEFWDLVRTIPNNSITNDEELSLATRYLHQAGYILHFSSHLRRLRRLYFINPQWLASTLAKFFTVDAVHSIARSGMVELRDAERVLFSESNLEDVHHRMECYIDLLESFDVALRIDSERLLLPSKLPKDKPGFQLHVRYQLGCRLMRLYAMRRVPSGFWSRLLVRLIGAMATELKVNRTADDSPAAPGQGQGRLSRDYSIRDSSKKYSVDSCIMKPKLTYWQTGICIDYSDTLMFIESADQYFYSSPAVKRDSNPLCDYNITDGVLLTVQSPLPAEHTKSDVFVLFAFAVDHIGSLVSQWYPGLLEDGAMNQYIPCPKCVSRQFNKESLRNVHMFTLIDCAKAVVTLSRDGSETVTCDVCTAAAAEDDDARIPLRQLVPDLLLLDVASLTHLDLKTQVVFDAGQDALGSGGEGCVYKGHMIDSGLHVAVKMNWLMADKSRINNIIGTNFSQDSGTFSSEIDLKSVDDAEKFSNRSKTSLGMECYWNSKLLEAFASCRQEVSTMSHFRHPCIVSLVGVSMPSLSYVMELCPGGNLRELLLQAESVSMATNDNSLQSKLNKHLVLKIFYQMSAALDCLHSKRIVYKDMKPENVLVWSTNVDDVVNIKLSDYGLAQRVTQQGVMGVEGTPGYQAPEMRSGRPYDEKVDIFALGMVAYELLRRNSSLGEASVLRLSRYIDEGNYSVADGTKLIIPQMASLIRTCWSRDPSNRPSASELCLLLKNLAFLGFEKSVNLEKEDIVGSCCALYWTPPLSLTGASTSSVVYRNKPDSVFSMNQTAPNQYLRFWTKTDISLRYHVFDMELGQFKIKNQGSWSTPEAVTCMLSMQQSLIVASQNHLSVVGLERGSNRLVQLSTPYTVPDVPLMLCVGRACNVLEFLVGYKSYGLQCFRVNEANIIYKTHDNLLPQRSADKSSSVTCAVWVSTELWVGCGSAVAIFTRDDDRYTLVERISILSDSLTVSQLVYDNDQLWLAGDRDKVHTVVELDVPSRCIICVFDCSRSAVLDCVIAITEQLEEAFDEVRYAKITDESVSGDVTCAAAGPDIRTRKLSSPSCQRKLSSQSKRSGNRWCQTQNCQSEPSGSVVSDYVTALAFVDGTLWIGLTSTDVLIVNVTRNNSYGYTYGQIVGKLSHRASVLPGVTDTWGPVEEIVNSGCSAVITVHSSDTERKIQTFRKWKRIGLDEVHKYRSIWSGLQRQQSVQL